MKKLTAAECLTLTQRAKQNFLKRHGKLIPDFEKIVDLWEDSDEDLLIERPSFWADLKDELDWVSLQKRFENLVLREAIDLILAVAADDKSLNEKVTKLNRIEFLDWLIEESPRFDEYMKHKEIKKLTDSHNLGFMDQY